MSANAVGAPRIAGVLLAAGEGRRFGSPKALADTGDGPWVVRGLATVGSLSPRLVVTGAAADQVRALLPHAVRAVQNPDFSTGMGSSLIAGLTALRREVDAAVIMLVDLPDVSATAVARVVAAALDASDGGSTAVSVRELLARATYRGLPGHPVLIGADHFAGVIAAAHEDSGARGYLADRAADSRMIRVECGDLATGADQDVATVTPRIDSEADNVAGEGRTAPLPSE